MDIIIKDMTIDDFGTCDYDDNNYLIGTGRVNEAEEFAPVRHGRWLHLHLDPDNITGHTKGECSICGKLRIVDNYCPNCGAKMDGDEE